MSAAAVEKPTFVYHLSRTPFTRNLVIFAIVFTFLAITLNWIYGYITFAVLFVVLALVQYFGLEKRMRSFRIEFYENHYKTFFQADLTQDTNYSEIDRIETKRQALREFYFLYAKKDNRLLTTIQISNQKHKELGGITLVDWLKGRIIPS